MMDNIYTLHVSDTSWDSAIQIYSMICT